MSKTARTREPRGRVPKTTYQLNFRVEGEVLQALEAAAKRARMPLSTWLTTVGLVAAGKTALVEQLDRIRRAQQGDR